MKLQMFQALKLLTAQHTYSTYNTTQLQIISNVIYNIYTITRLEPGTREWRTVRDRQGRYQYSKKWRRERESAVSRTSQMVGAGAVVLTAGNKCMLYTHTHTHTHTHTRTQNVYIDISVFLPPPSPFFPPPHPPTSYIHSYGYTQGCGLSSPGKVIYFISNDNIYSSRWGERAVYRFYPCVLGAAGGGGGRAISNLNAICRLI